MDYTKRLEFISSLSVDLAEPNKYVTQMIQEADLHVCMIEIKKQITFEKGTLTKVLITHRLEEEANEIDQALFNIEFNKLQHVS